MGIKLFGNSYGNTEAPNPDPGKYEPIAMATIDGRTILVARYKGCTTFNGIKVLVWNSPIGYELCGQSRIDPHLLETDDVMHPDARFSPSEEGIAMMEDLFRPDLRPSSEANKFQAILAEIRETR